MSINTKTMKKISRVLIPGFIVASLLVGIGSGAGSASIVHAQTTTVSRTDRPFFENFSNRIERVVERLTAAHDRMVGISDRIEDRAEKLSKDGVNVTESLKFVSTAREELAKANQSITNIESSFKTEANATSTEKLSGGAARSAFVKTLTNIKDAKESLKKAHRSLVSAVKSLKPGINKTNTPRTATSTPR
jgi:hypothetical protein